MVTYDPRIESHIPIRVTLFSQGYQMCVCVYEYVIVFLPCCCHVCCVYDAFDRSFVECSCAFCNSLEWTDLGHRPHDDCSWDVDAETRKKNSHNNKRKWKRIDECLFYIHNVCAVDETQWTNTKHWMVVTTTIKWSKNEKKNENFSEHEWLDVVHVCVSVVLLCTDWSCID